ncbi:MAG: ComEC/Rec2 family competence protein [Verrucomicrobia bacterium]|nr:ComEC/Rec2 family competence protein [Verrucomicrobiota bacterium]
MARPLLTVALIYSAGIVLADLFATLPSPFLLLALSLILGVAALGWLRARPILLWFFVFTVGAANLAQRKAVLAPDDLRVVLGERAEIATIRGRLVETPYHRVYEQQEEIVWRTIGRVDVESVHTKRGGWRPASGRVTISTPGVVAPEFFGGRSIQVEGVLQLPRRAVAEGVFDYRAFLARQGIYYQLQVESTNDWRLGSAAMPSDRRPVADRFGDWAKKALARGLPVEDQPLQLLWTMTLGWKTALSGEVAEPFMRSGTMHVFAISGLHVALIAGLLVALLKVCRVPRTWCAWIVIPLIWFYAGVTGWQASAVRSTIMMTVVIAGWALKRPSDLLNSLAGAAFIILLWDPQQIFQAGFQLSFLVVFSLALLTPLFDSIHRPLLEPENSEPTSQTAHPVRDWLVARVPGASLVFPDPLLPDELRPRWQRWIGWPVRYLFRASATSLAAWLGSIPVIAYYFHLLTPISLLANLIVVPLSSVALACNLASMTVGSLVPFVGELFNHAAWLFMLLMIRLSEWSAQIPGACVHVGTPSASFFLLYYAVLIAVTAGWLFRPRWRVWSAAAILVLGAMTLWTWRSERAVAHLTLVPLGSGDAAYFRPAGGGADLLIDCGNESSAEFALKPFLRGQGINRPSALLLTHGDVNSVGGAALIRERFPPRQVVTSEVQFRSGAYRDAIRIFENMPDLLRRVKRGDRVGPWEVLHPAAGDSFSQADDNTIVLSGHIEGVRVLFLSDLGKPGQNALMERYPNLKADLVISGLPAQGEPLANSLLEGLGAKLIVVMDAEYPASRRASQKLRDRLAEHSVEVLYLHQTAALHFRFSKGQWVYRAMNQVATTDGIPE